MTVLVVDDEAVARTMAAGALRAAGYDVVTATDGAEALAILEQRRCRIVVSDWQMPGLDGLALCRAIREADWLGYTYFIMLTGRTTSDDTVEGLAAGADDFLIKPFNPAELVMRVKAGQRVTTLQNREMTIFVLAKLAESRDPETGAHLERVQRYAQRLSQRLQTMGRYEDVIDAEFVRLIYLTSPLHDIGKVAIPDSVLLKPGRLTTEEFEVMKTHTLRGAETLAAALAECPEAAFLEMARDIALSHHERYDGSGYPHGLAGERIPLAARIVAIADVYDALTSKRVYKDAMSHDEAVSIIQQETGAHFDPVIVEAFLAERETFRQIEWQFRDARAAA